MKIYTKTGDTGETGQFAGPRVWKNHPRIEAYGTVDELNAVLGWARGESPPATMDELLTDIQHQLFALGAELATPDPQKHGTALLTDLHIAGLEEAIDRYEAALPPLKQFILPSGTRLSAVLHVARAVCRRAERCVVTLRQSPEAIVSQRVVTYLNRLSDLLFVLARAANAAHGRTDVPWQKPS